MVNIVLRNKKPGSESLLNAEVLASHKLVWSNPCTEVSQTANTCTEEQERMSSINVPPE
jgi:hypothetical protein